MLWFFEDNINTDLITPGRYNITTDPNELAKIAFIEYRPEFAKEVQKDDLIIGGSNFGCGSSRETAVTSLKACGIKAVIAKSFARIFYRNCLNKGLLAITADTGQISENDEIEIDFENNLIINKTQNTEIPANIPTFAVELDKYGGIINYIKQNGTDKIGELFEK
jgi:3-isopropylmalate/(R)-2-methylmalate dehydratase small subunit